MVLVKSSIIVFYLDYKQNNSKLKITHTKKKILNYILPFREEQTLFQITVKSKKFVSFNLPSDIFVVNRYLCHVNYKTSNKPNLSRKNKNNE